MWPQASVKHISRLLFKCRKPNQRHHALRLHARMSQCGIETHLLLGNHLVSILAEVRSIQLAHCLLKKLVQGNAQAWNSLILGYIKCGLPKQAIKLFKTMHEKNSVQASEYTLVNLLKACLNSHDLRVCICIHSEIVRVGLLERNLLVGNTLVTVYSGCGLVFRAREVADQLSSRDVVTWNVIMGAYAKLELHGEVFECLDHMLLEGIYPDSITFSQCLKACGILEDKDRGAEIHELIKRNGFLERDHIVGSSLVDMYCKWGLLTEAQQVFEKLPHKDVVSWTILIRGFADHGSSEEALQLFEKMQAVGLFPDEFTLACCLKAYVQIGAADQGQQLHLEVEKRGLLEKDQVIGNMLVDLYSKCNLLPDAQQIFDTLPNRDSVSWNALIAGYGEHGHDEDALDYFQRMLVEGVFPDAISYVCLLKSCGRTGYIDTGRDIHAEIERRDLIQKDFSIGNTIVDMYVRCGLLTKAKEVFDKLPYRDIVTWTILLSGYAEHGHATETMNCFNDLERLGFPPDAERLVCSLQACSKRRALDSGNDVHAGIQRKWDWGKDLKVGSNLMNSDANFETVARASNWLT